MGVVVLDMVEGVVCSCQRRMLGLEKVFWQDERHLRTSISPAGRLAYCG